MMQITFCMVTIKKNTEIIQSGYNTNRFIYIYNINIAILQFKCYALLNFKKNQQKMFMYYACISCISTIGISSIPPGLCILRDNINISIRSILLPYIPTLN